MTKTQNVLSKAWKRPVVKADPRAQQIRQDRREHLRQQREVEQMRKQS